MLVIPIFAIVFLAVLLVAVALFAKSPSEADAALAEKAAKESGERIRNRMPPAVLHDFVVALLASMRLRRVEEDPASSPDGSSQRLVATEEDRFGDRRYVVFIEADPPGHVVDAPTVLELAEEVKAGVGSVGLLFTPFAIDASVVPGVDASLELVDGPKLRELVAKYLPERAAELDSYDLYAPLRSVPQERGPARAPRRWMPFRRLRPSAGIRS